MGESLCLPHPIIEDSKKANKSLLYAFIELPSESELLLPPLSTLSSGEKDWGAQGVVIAFTVGPVSA